MKMKRHVIACLTASWFLGCCVAANSATFQVGPTRTFESLDSLLNAVELAPGDVVQIDGDTVYPGGVTVNPQHSGTTEAPVTFRGMPVDGRRPHFRGGNNTLHNRASHVVFENLELSGTGNTSSGTFRCFFHQGTGVVLRGLYIHDCPRQGLLGADQGSGSLTMEYSVVMNIGSGGRNHAIYMATDEVAYPGSVFRLQYSFISDSQFDDGEIGGNLIKSRAERNEIYFNWLEGAYYHELELIGPDPGGAPGGWSEGLTREDSDIVGNIIVHTADFGSILRFGGDATGQSFGRYRFVHNTVLRTGGGQATVFRLFDGIESLQASNNVFFNPGPSALRIIREVEAIWLNGSTQIVGDRNWIEDGSSFIPAGFSASLVGADPGFADLGALNLTPAAASPLVNAAVLTPQVAGFEISNPLAVPASLPPSAPPLEIGGELPRPMIGSLDVGALENGAGALVFSNGFEE